MKLSKLAFVCCVLLNISQPATAQTTQEPLEEFASLNWKRGPYTVEISKLATLSFGKEYIFLGSDHTNRALEIMGNLPSTQERYLVGKDDMEWFAVFHFVNDGYVSDVEKIDADALLDKLMDGNKEGNKERRQKGLQILKLAGWSVPPHYNTETKRLEWGTRLENEDGTATVNYTSRLLSRSGYMVAVLVGDPETLSRDVTEYKELLTQFSFNPGEKYSEFREGDRVAEYGLAALVAGGAAAAAWKFKGLWKIIGVGVFAAFAAIGGFFKSRSRKG